MFFSLFQCSVSCGSGIQIRTVECQESHGAVSLACDQKMKPVSGQPCSTGISCSQDTPADEPYVQPLKQAIRLPKAEKIVSPRVPSEAT